MPGKQPDLSLSAYDTDTRAAMNNLGVGWTQDDGSISIALNPGTALVYNRAVRYKLWPRNQMPAGGPPLASESSSGRQPEQVSRARPSGFDDMDDDIPF